MISGSTWRTEKRLIFGWGAGVSAEKWAPIWSPDETHIYRCCYFYGDARTGAGHTISDESTILEGHPDTNPMQSLHHTHGLWLNDTYVLAQFGGFFAFRDRPLPIFDVYARTFRNLGALAGLPDEFNNMPYTRPSISPDGDYMWMSSGLPLGNDPEGYLIDLRTLKSQLYHSSVLDWSANGKYAIVGSQVLTLSNKTLRPFPAEPDSDEPEGDESGPL